MTEPANTLVEAGPQPPPTGKVRLLGPNNVVYAVDASAANQYEQHGYTRYEGPTIDEGSIEAKFAGWRKAVGAPLQAAGLGAINQVPLLDYGLDKLAPDTAKRLADATAQAREEHGTAYAAGSIGGALGTFALGGAALKGAGAALNIGAKLPGLAAAAESSPVLAAAAEGALGNAAFNAADQVDSQALEHAASPEGQEKLAFSFGDLAAAAGLGAVLPSAVGGLAQGTERAARGVQRWARGRLLSDFVPEVEQQALRDVGKGHVLDLAQELTERGQGSDQVVREIGNKIHVANTKMDELLFHTRDHAMTLDEAKAAHAAILAHTGRTNLTLDDIKPLTEAITSHEAASVAEQRLEAVRARVKAMRDGGLMDSKTMAATLKQPLAEAEAAKKALKDLPRDKELQEMSRALYDRVRFRKPLGSEHYEDYLPAGRALSEARDALYLRVRPEGAEAFRQIKGELSDHLALAESVNKKHIPSVMEALSKAEGSAAVSGTMAALSLRGGSVLGNAALGGATAMMYYGNIRSVATAARFVASHINLADKRLAQFIKAGLYGTATSRVSMHPYEFQTQAARVQAAQRDPVTSFANIHDGLIQSGLPEHLADRVAPRLHAVVQASAQSLPKRQTSPDLASAAQPDLHQQRAWLSEHRSRMDPTYALAHPTAQNMLAAKQHHPETIARAQEAVMDALHKNPYLPIASRMWAARVLGRPAGGLTSPTFYQSLSQMRAKADAEAQQQQGQVSSTRQRGNGPSSVAQSEQTRLGELSTP